MQNDQYGIENFGVYGETIIPLVAGSKVGIQANAGEIWVPLGIKFNLATDATVINRTVQIFLTEGGVGATQVLVTAPYTQGANEDQEYYCAMGLENKVSQNFTNRWIEFPFPKIQYIRSNQDWEITVFNIQAGDVLRNITFSYYVHKARA